MVNVHDQTFWLKNLKLANHYNNWIFSQILPYLGRDVLEVGCGNGNFTELLADQGRRVVAVDVNEEYVCAAKRRLQSYPAVEVKLANVTQIQWQKSFDTVVMLDVLEHIKNDVDLLDRLGSCLGSGGKLIVKVPALNWLYSDMDKTIGHHRRYIKKTLAQAFHKAHFSSPLIWYFNFAGIPGWWLNGKVLGRSTPPSSQISLFNKFVPFLRTMEAKVKPPIGLSLIAVATKL